MVSDVDVAYKVDIMASCAFLIFLLFYAAIINQKLIVHDLQIRQHLVFDHLICLHSVRKKLKGLKGF